MWAAVAGWAVAQSLKVLLNARRERRLDFQWFVDTGGMPSAHSAFVAALATATGVRHGFGSGLFALAAAFAIVVMADAAGLRRAAGQQAETLNRIVDDLYQTGHVRPERLRELLGHTPVEVLSGATLGALVALAVLRLSGA